jgi:NAD(P)-dependent dehydrogenase (short-subunit alcohol dehydrogenase family)
VSRGCVVVAGGTGSLGRAVVLGLLSSGDSVAVPYRGEAGWQSLAGEAGAGTALWGAAADAADTDAMARFVDAAAGRFGGVSGLVTAAGGYAASGTLERAPVDEWRRMMSLNLDTAFAACRSALPHLLDKGGSVVTVASRVAEGGGAGAAAYAVAKSGVVALTRVLALENRDRGVRFNCVAPGIIDTEANRRALPDADRSGWTSPAAIARVILFLLSPESQPTTGALVPVDGGA